ncbi:unnamed protein product [Mytilus coruscus]|uniref:Integrase catalytic domain-containing protein n=1 Tax=Mytilus coruscus TaxID=42192 RepID=A0A6J8ADR3_MYTCO|nr:unnamed protein product [Mytilus coruscus]
MKDRREILEFAHDNRTAAHLGIKRTLARIKESFYWTGIRGNTWSYIAGCSICNKRKKPIPKRKAPMQVKESVIPWRELLHISLGNSSKVTKAINIYKLSVTIILSGLRVTVCPTWRQLQLQTFLWLRLFLGLGYQLLSIPIKVVNSRATCFNFKEMCKMLQIEKTRTAPYHPKSDGMVERFNKTLASMLTGTPKFTNQWRGPYKVLKINSSVTYTVDCGRKGVGQVIHVDRMRPCTQQILRGENLVDEQSPEKTGELELEIHEEEVIIDSLPLVDVEDHEDVDNDRPRRVRKPPSWMKDYEH